MGRSEEPRALLTALAGVGALSVLQRSADPPTWQSRLSALGTFAVAAVAVLFVAGALGALLKLGPFLPGLRSLTYGMMRWQLIVQPLNLVVVLGPVLLAAIAIGEWRRAGEPGIGGPWFQAVVAAVIVLCAACVLSAALAVLAWISPGTALAIMKAGTIPLRVINLAALLSALSLPALIAKMLESGSTVGARAPSGPPPPTGAGRASMRSTASKGGPAAPTLVDAHPFGSRPGRKSRRIAGLWALRGRVITRLKRKEKRRTAHPTWP